MRRLSTKEAGRALSLLPLLFVWAHGVSAQIPHSPTRASPRAISPTSNTADTQTSPTRQQALIFSEAVPRLIVDQSFQFAVAAVNPDGTQVRLTDVSWRSSSPDIASVSRSGMVVALREGRSFISARSGRSEVRVRVSVLPKSPIAANPIATVEVTPSIAAVEAGTTLQFASSARTSEGAVVPDAPVTFSSLDTNIARITTAGLLSARREGTVEVTASTGSVSGKVVVKVGRSRVERITVLPVPLTATTSDTVALTVSAVRRDGTAVDPSELTATARRGTFRGWTYIPPTTVGTDSVTVASNDGVAVVVPVTVNAVVAPAPTEPAPVAPPADGALPRYAVPALPAAFVNTAMPAVTGRTIRVPAGDAAAFQQALNSAVGGDEIVLSAGAEYVGGFVLPKHAGTGAVTVRSESVPVNPGTRVTPSTAAAFARIVTPAYYAAISTASGARDWRLIGLSITLRPGSADNYGIVTLGAGTETDATQYVSNIVLDRVFISGGSTGNTSRCVAFNGNSLAVIDSWLEECHAKGRDAQGVGGWTGYGPYLIHNNRIEGSGMSVMFGGSDPKVVGAVQSDIVVTNNHFFKPLAWSGGRWTVKNAFELKSAKRVLVENNLMENVWMDGQTGFAILLQTVNQDGGAPWSTIQDVTIRNNVIRNATGGLNVLSRITSNGFATEGPMRRVLVRNNLFQKVGRDPVAGQPGRFLQMVSDFEDVSIIQNTFYGAASNSVLAMDVMPSRRTVLFNNVFDVSEYGVKTSGLAEGSSSLATTMPDAVFEGNALTGRPSQFYPAKNFFPTALGSGDFQSSSDFTLRSTLPYAMNAGTYVGVNGSLLQAAFRSATPP